MNVMPLNIRKRVKLHHVLLMLAFVSCAIDLPTSFAQSASAPASKQVGPVPAMLARKAESGLLLDVAAVGRQFVAVGANGNILRSEDAMHWTQVSVPVDITLTRVAFADEKHGWAVGHDAVILHTVDGGTSWSLQNFQPDINAPLFSVMAIDPQRALAVGAFGTLKITQDGGTHWTDVNAPTVTADKLHLNAIGRLANGDLLIVGEHGLLATSKDGQTWKRLTPTYDGSFFGLLPQGDKGAVAFGLRGNVYATDDVDANHWRKIESGTTSSFFGGAILPGNNLVLVGGDGVIVRIGADGSAHSIAQRSQDGSAYGTLTEIVSAHQNFIVVGESGVAKVALK